MNGIAKREAFKSREKKFIQRCIFMCLQRPFNVPQRRRRTMVVNMVWAVEKGNEELTLAMLWLVSYLFLLRVPSEVAGSGAHRPRVLRHRLVYRHCPCASVIPDPRLQSPSRLSSGGSKMRSASGSKDARTDLKGAG